MQRKMVRINVLCEKLTEVLLLISVIAIFYIALFGSTWTRTIPVKKKDVPNVPGLKLNNASHSNKINIMLFGYNRGATTFVGHVIGCRDDTFYMYEPLWKIARHTYFNGSQLCDFNRNRCREKDTTVDATILNSLYTCKPETISKLVADVQSQNSCSRNRKAFQSMDVSQLRYICVNSKVVVTKVLRITANIVEDLVREINNLKIVFLFRDPRAIISSRSKGKSKQHKLEVANSLCKKMLYDSNLMLYLAEKYPKNIIFLSAERLANDPINVTRTLFRFLGIKFTKSDKTQSKELSSWKTNHDKRREGKFNPYKNDGYAAIMKWRTVLSMEFKQNIDNVCTPVYQKLGYLNLTSMMAFRNIEILNIQPLETTKFIVL